MHWCASVLGPALTRLDDRMDASLASKHIVHVTLHRRKKTSYVGQRKYLFSLRLLTYLVIEQDTADQ